MGPGLALPTRRSHDGGKAKVPLLDHFLEALGAGRRLAVPFVWGDGGANSELARRTGGEKLYERLANLERIGVPYHLVAHSHGGSVIWHALVLSARERRKLDNLSTWITVGTPFLEFEPDPMALWQATGFASVAAVLALLWPSIFTLASERWVIFSEGNLWALTGVIALGLLLVALFLFFGFRVTMLVTQLLASRTTKAAERQAAIWYEDSWLGLWHDRDEPITGLQASLNDAPKIVPRLATPERSPVLRVLMAPYDWLAAPIGDAFAWATIMSKLQGSDEIGKVMMSAGPAPSALAPGWPPLFNSLAVSLRGSADTRAGVSAGRLRDALAAAARESSGQAALVEIAKVIGWDEIIHTSYFDAPEMGAIIATRIAGNAMPAHVPANFQRLTAAVSPARRQRRRSLRLPAAATVTAAALALLLGGSFYAAYQSVVEPLTDGFQLSAIGSVFNQRRTMAAADGRAAGDLLARLHAAKALPLGDSKRTFAHDISRRIFGAVELMPGEDQRFAALQVVFFHLGAGGLEKELRELFADVHVALDQTQDDKFEAVLAPAIINPNSISRTAVRSGSSQLVTQEVKIHTHQTASKSNSSRSRCSMQRCCHQKGTGPRLANDVGPPRHPCYFAASAFVSSGRAD